MADVAAAVLEAAAQADKQYASILVEKPLELELDLGNMLAVDTNQIENSKLLSSDERESYLSELARGNTQILINAIWALPTTRVEEVVVARFPPPSFPLPREKPVPQPKVLTKWEKYAKDKGITNTKKKDRLVWDDVVNKWVPQFGFKKKQAEKEKNWCIPIKEGPVPNLNPFEKMEEEKKEKKAKNELQRLRNIARAKNVKVPTVGVMPVPTTRGSTKSVGFSDELKNAAEHVQVSTASLGKFQPKLTKQLEKGAKTKGKKRKFEANTGDSSQEKEKNLGILESITNKQAKIDINSAVGKKIYQDDTERSEEKQNRKGKPGKRKGGKPAGKGKGKGNFKGGNSKGGNSRGGNSKGKAGGGGKRQK